MHEVDDDADLHGHQELSEKLEGTLEIEQGVLVDDDEHVVYDATEDVHCWNIF